MSSQQRLSSENRKLTSDRAFISIKRQLPQPYRGRFSYSFSGRRRHDYTLLMRTQRPIQGYLVTHRRRFTTGHKHKQAYLQ
ncbi:MAG TPA: hypothetical protein VHP83_27100 [Aggregatilineaceae bacterium]|nr:hypothetical protein [Aggregatilineaceae bacterium]